MSDAVRVAFREPSSFTFGEDKTGWTFTTVDGKRKFVCFDDALVKAFTERKLAGEEHDYETKPPGQGKRDPQLVGIAGVYTKRKGGGGGGGAGRPLLSDRQAALMAGVRLFAPHGELDAFQRAALVDAALAVAERFARWLGVPATAPTPAGNEPQARRRAAGPGPQPEPAVRPPKPTPAAEIPARPKTLARLRGAARAAHVELDTICATRGVASLERLTEAQALEAVANCENLTRRAS